MSHERRLRLLPIDVSMSPKDDGSTMSRSPDRKGPSILMNESEISSEPLPGRDFILRRSQKNRERRNAEAQKECQTGLEELQHDFADKISGGNVPLADWDFWARVVEDYPTVARRQASRLRREIQRGFPKELRGLLWQVIASSKSPALEVMYASLVKEQSPLDSAISKDVCRTPLTEEHESLANVLRAYSLFDPQVGYTQGMAFVAAPLLLNLKESEAFCLFVQIMKVYEFRSFVLPGMPGLHLRLYQFDRLCEDRFEKLHVHLKREGVLPSMYASQWFLTLYAYRFPLSLVERILDIVIAEGLEAVLKFALALIESVAPQVMKLRFDDLLPFLKERIFDEFAENPNELVARASQVELTPAILAKYELEHNEITRIERERNEQLDTLRASNAILVSQLRLTETSLESLNMEHIEIANKMVETGLENARLREQNEQLHHELLLYREAAGSLKTTAEILREKNQLEEIRSRLESQIASLQDALGGTIGSPS